MRIATFTRKITVDNTGIPKLESFTKQQSSYGMLSIRDQRFPCSHHLLCPYLLPSVVEISAVPLS